MHENKDFFHPFSSLSVSFVYKWEVNEVVLPNYVTHGNFKQQYAKFGNLEPESCILEKLKYRIQTESILTKFSLKRQVYGCKKGPLFSNLARSSLNYELVVHKSSFFISGFLSPLHPILCARNLAKRVIILQKKPEKKRRKLSVTL